ncbi:hypothetical protein A9CBEGH2_04830 [Amedibacterium intestinale]|jgi:hypothetical protein|uniref:DUF7678 domain-containing protein n=1 Tax=Amedibacterium intestinale TaxID=2583452 RepID=UPI0013738768|nr:hypothetical protein [Amedibacterium intestinale]BBK61543.1 hypothetical protein A9CBEGH2_04830 [Amedibacterium intestinale]
MWSEGTIGIPTENGKYKSVRYWVKHYEEPSEDYGIDGGKISKLTLRMDGEEIANYDRGWDIKPTCEEAEFALAILMKEYN